MKIIENIKTLGGLVADLVFPVYCLVCGREGVFLCDDCGQVLPRRQNQICIVCAKPAAFGKTHPDCISKNKLDGIISALDYKDSKVSRLIETFKYKFIDQLSPKFAQIIKEAIVSQGLTGYFENFTLIPVPLHKRRLAWRGFNQAELIAKYISPNLYIPLNTNLVTRSRFTTPQTALKKEKRLENIQNAFQTNFPVSGKYLLVDDVVTTGATLNEIAKLLKKNGATEVWAITLAHG